MVGLIPLFAVETLESELIDTLPGFKRRMQWFIENLPEFADCIETRTTPTNIRRFMALVSRERLRRVLTVMLDESEFLSPYGIRSLSRVHRDHPYTVRLGQREYRVDYEPAESRSKRFGGNSNWRGPVWFPVNFLIVESLQKFHWFWGDDFTIECPTGSGRFMNLWDVSMELERRLTRIFLRDEEGRRPVYGGSEKFQRDPHWRDLRAVFRVLSWGRRQGARSQSSDGVDGTGREVDSAGLRRDGVAAGAPAPISIEERIMATLTLKGSKTHENLKRAFAGEAEANRRYVYFARQADVEGYPDIAGLFRDTAEGETGHSSGHMEFLKRAGDPVTDLPIGSTVKNLESAIAGETQEFTNQYPQMAETARAEGFVDIAEWFDTLAKAERNHAARFSQGLKSMRS